jgi:hypothetical protein
MTLGTVLITSQVVTTISSVVSLPMSRIATILQTHKNGETKKVIQEILEKEGKLGFFKDTLYNIALDMVNDITKVLLNGFFSSIFQWILPTDKNRKHFAKNLLIFGLSSACTKLITYPLVTIHLFFNFNRK